MALVLKDYKTTKHSGIKMHKDGIKFLFDVKINGIRYRKTFKAPIAQSKADKLKTAYGACEQFILAKTKELNSTADMSATVDEYYKSLKASNNWSDKTRQGYDDVYNKYIKSLLGNKKISDVAPAMFTKLNSTVKHLSKGSQKKLYDILIPLFKLAIEDEIINKSPIKNIHVPKRNQLSEKKVIIDAVTKYKTLYKALNQLFNSTDIIQYKEDDITKYINCTVNPHHLALFLFGFHGRRLTESASLQWSDIDFINNKYRIKGKNSKINTDMIFTLPLDIKVALEQFKDVSGDVFNVKHPIRYYKYIRQISGLNEFSFHWMRNLAVSALSTSGVSATELSAMLGHTDAGTLRKYLSLQRDTATSVTNDASQRLLA